jgi:hypothetical protein
MPTLHVQVCAGFANRVRALVSAICLAEDLQIPLVLHWFPMSPECACRFSAVLDAESLPKTCKVVPEDLYQAIEVQSSDTWDLLYRRWDQKSDLYLKSYGKFYANAKWEAHLRALKPTRLVKEFLQRRCNDVPWEKAIGVHIRRGDNKKSIEGSPLENFLQKMRENKEAFYVVATDDTKVKEQIISEFGDRCIFPAVTLSRKTEEGMMNGVADFFALAKCVEVWGSYWSSFSEIASVYGNIGLTIV